MDMNDLKWDDHGLMPAIIQDQSTRQVLMLGYLNRETLEETLNLGRVVFWSRSRKSRWLKGETSGNFLKVEEISTDCDSDALLILVKPEGPTCHTGETSCFGASDA